MKFKSLQFQILGIFGLLITGCRYFGKDPIANSINKSIDSYGISELSLVTSLNGKIYWEKRGKVGEDAFETDSVITRLASKLFSESARDNPEELLLKPNQQIDNGLENLLTMSGYFDRHYSIYTSYDEKIENLAPTWYSKGKADFFGYHVLTLNQHNFLWTGFENGENSFLVIKAMEKPFFMAAAYPTGSLPSPEDYRSDDLLQSPVAIAALKAILWSGKIPEINYQKSLDDIERSLRTYKTSPYYVLLKKEILANARLATNWKDPATAKNLLKLYQTEIEDSLLTKYIDKPAVAAINYVKNDMDYTIPFNLDEDQDLLVFAGGQASRPATYETVQFDNIQIFLNPAGNRRNRENNETQLYQFNYGSSQLTANNKTLGKNTVIDEPELKFVFNDLTDTSYVLELKIPWNILGWNNQIPPQEFSMNLFLNDSDLDEGKRKSILSWPLDSSMAWYDAQNYATVILSTQQRSSLANHSLKIPEIGSGPVIDGRPDTIWDRVADFTPIDHMYQGGTIPSDNSGKFKLLWNKEALYALFRITDNIKNKPGTITRDKCWIKERETGNIVWKMDAGNPQGPISSVSTHQRIHLKKGTYLLKYQSDDRHSFEKWESSPPKNDLYGARIYQALPL